jgi:hypothetical protein
METPLCLKCSRPLILSAMDPSGSGPAWKCLPCELSFTLEQLATFKPGEWAPQPPVVVIDCPRCGEQIGVDSHAEEYAVCDCGELVFPPEEE